MYCTEMKNVCFKDTNKTKNDCVVRISELLNRRQKFLLVMCVVGLLCVVGLMCIVYLVCVNLGLSKILFKRAQNQFDKTELQN